MESTSVHSSNRLAMSLRGFMPAQIAVAACLCFLYTGVVRAGILRDDALGSASGWRQAVPARTEILQTDALAPAVLLRSDAGAPLSGIEQAGGADTLASWRRAFGDLESATKTFAADAVHVYSSPVRMNRTQALWTGGIIATTGVLYAYDGEIHEWFQRNKGEDWYGWFDDVGESIETAGHMGKTTPYYFGALLVGYLFKIEKLTTISAQILESHVIAGGIKGLLNVAVGRRRPLADLGPYSYKFNDGTSFPSGHASNTFQLANILSYHARYWPFRVLFFSLATTVAFQRVASSAHWPSDVLGAAVFGYAVSREVLRLGEKRRLTVAPAVLPGGGPGVALHFMF